MSSKKGKTKKNKDKKKNQETSEQAQEYASFDIHMMKKEALDLQTKLTKLERERNLFQTESDTVQSYHDVTVQNLNDIANEILMTDLEIEKIEDENRVEKRVHMHKVKHLEYQHGKKQEKLRADEVSNINEENKNHVTSTQNLVMNKNEIQQQLHDLDLICYKKIRLLKGVHTTELDKNREHNESELKELVEASNRRLSDLNDRLEQKEKFHIHEVNERKNLHINDLIENHDSSVDRIKAYYGEVTKENLTEIKKLEEVCLLMKKKAVENKDEIRSTSKENQELANPLASALASVSKLSDSVRHQEKDKQSLKNVKARLSLARDNLEQLNTDYESLKKKLDITRKERDELYQRFDESISSMCKASDCKNLILEKRLKIISNELEVASVQVNEILQNVPIDINKTAEIKSSIKDMINEKNNEIRRLQVNLASEKKKYEQERNIVNEESVSVAMTGF